ncbi:MAG TPA: CBS domain-containing protein [Burkholderiales bacterium]|nr:CBS domain-containing protein [Burkholderiales bacterium]
MQVKDIMTQTVISAGSGASVMEIAALMVDHRISAVPVTDDGAVVGIVSEADLLHRYEIGTARDPAARPWWQRLFADDVAPWSYVESHAMKVSDIMTTPVVTVAADMPVDELAALFESRGIKRAPVLNSGAVVGIVSRFDFVRALAARAKVRREEHSTSDESIRIALLAELESQSWWHTRRASVSVANGVVRITGMLDSAEEKLATRVAAENIPGVRSVEDERTVSIPAGGGYI